MWGLFGNEQVRDILPKQEKDSRVLCLQATAGAPRSRQPGAVLGIVESGGKFRKKARENAPVCRFGKRQILETRSRVLTSWGLAVPSMPRAFCAESRL